MRMRKVFVGAVLVAGSITLSAGPAEAAGGGGESFCSFSGAPVGGAPDQIGNAGEYISWVAQNLGHGRFLHPGPFVASFCNPTSSSP